MERLPRSTLANVRAVFAKMVDSGAGPDEVMSRLQLGRSTYFKWKKLYVEGGVEALAVAVPDRPRSYALNPSQIAQLVGWLSHSNPDQFQFDFQLWTRKIVADLIEIKFGVRMTPQGVGKLLRRLGFSPQRPLFRSVKQDPVEVERWRSLDYPAIARYAKRRKATVFFVDEASVRSDHHAGRTWAPIGHTPVLLDSGDRVSVNMISAVSPLGELKFQCHEGRFNSEKFVEFLGYLSDENNGRPLFVVCDNVRVHKSTFVYDWLVESKRDIEIFFLPPYSPQLNADEWVWNHLKNHTVGRTPIMHKSDLFRIVENGLASLATKTGTIRGFFRDPDLRYILDGHEIVY